MRVKQQKIKVYMEGIEFPGINTVALTEQKGAPPSCEMLTSFSSRITDLLPKTLCHVFYWYNDKYILIFAGELTSVSFDKNALQRTCRLQFTAMSLNWRNHYLLCDDLKHKFFDEGAFLVVNSSAPFTSDRNEKSSYEKTFGTLKYSEDSYTLTKDKFENCLEAGGTTSNLSIYQILRDHINFPIDLFFAFMCGESVPLYYFSKDSSSYEVKTGNKSDYTLTTLIETELPENANLHTYDKLHHYDQTTEHSMDLYSRTAWGLTGVMGKFLKTKEGLSQREADRLINGILYKEKVRVEKNINKVNTFKDTKTGKFYEIPSIEYLVYLQCKAAYGLLKDKFGEKFDPSNPYLTINPLEMIRLWLGKNTSIKDGYVQTINKYFEKYRGTQKKEEQIVVTSSLPSEGGEKGERDYYEPEPSPPWLQFILKGGNAVGLAQTKIADALVKEDLSKIIADILLATANQSTYCKLLYTAEGLNDNRIYVFDNKPAATLVKIEGMIDFVLQNSSSQLTSITSAMQLIKIITDALGYEVLEIATPMADVKNIIITPDTTFMPPILPNIFFPDQINDLLYSRSMESEPTRFVSYTDPVFCKKSNDSNRGTDMRLVYVTPKIPDIGDEDYIGRNKKRQYTFEECWRGVHAAHEISGETPFEESILKILQTKEEGKEEEEEGILQGPTEEEFTLDIAVKKTTASKFINTYWRSMVDGAFLKRRYMNRNATLNTVYDPNRICGFPALVIDEELPSVVGVINSIVSTITADGQTASQISLSHCHTYWDESLDKYTIVEGVYNHAQDAIPSIEHVWRWLKEGDEESKYTWYNIGKELYSPMLGLEKDCSIIAYTDTELKNPDIIKQTSEMDNWTCYASGLSNAIKNIKNIYKDVYEDNHYLFSDSVISRSLMDKSSFWKWYVDNSNGPSKINYKRALDVQTLQTSSRPPSFDNYIHKPFVIERRNKVDEIINANIKALPEELKNE